MTMQTASITLSDNRQLSYNHFGSRDDPTIFFFHGGGSAADGLELDGRATRHRVQILSPARPGIGGSDQAPGRTLTTFADDVSQLVRHLDIERFAALGISGGGPYALAVANALPHLVTGAAVLSCGGPFDIPGAFDGMARPNRMMWNAVDRRPRVARFVLGQQAKQVAKDPTGVARSAVRMLRGADAHAVAQLTETQRNRFFAEPMVEALANGPTGMLEDMQILRRSWDFDPALVRVPVDLWHGQADTSAPVAMARHLARLIPGCTLHTGSDEGHLSTILGSIDEAIGKTLVRSGG